MSYKKFGVKSRLPSDKIIKTKLSLGHCGSGRQIEKQGVCVLNDLYQEVIPSFTAISSLFPDFQATS